MKEEIGRDIEEEGIFICSIAILDIFLMYFDVSEGKIRKEKIRYFYIFYSHIGYFSF